MPCLCLLEVVREWDGTPRGSSGGSGPPPCSSWNSSKLSAALEGAACRA